jgi:HNH endonuclease
VWGLDAESVGVALDMDTEKVSRIVVILHDKQMIDGEDGLTAWHKRQPLREREDNSGERVRAFRKRLKDGQPTASNNYMRLFHAIYKRDFGACVYCGETDKELLGLDHAIPRSQGGDDDPLNLYLSCRRCNARQLWPNLRRSRGRLSF